MTWETMHQARLRTLPAKHPHVFLGSDHEQSERKTWWVIALCGCMMLVEIGGGILFGSIALVADGLHMSTHAGALLLASLAYRFARKYADDPRFTFGTGKLGDLAGFTSAIVLAIIALLIAYEAIQRFFAPVPIRFGEAIPIACIGLAVNVASVWLLSGGRHHHHHGHGDDHRDDHDHDAEHRIAALGGDLALSIYEHDHPPVFRIRAARGTLPSAGEVTIATVRPGGERQFFAMAARGDYLESVDDIPEPHAFTARVQVDGAAHTAIFAERGAHGHGAAHRDNNMRAALIHVMADATVSVLVIVGLLLARAFGWIWMDPLAGLIGACVIASWSYGLVRDTGAILLDMNPDPEMTDKLRRMVESSGDRLADLHVWRLGPGHLGAIISVATSQPRDAGYYRAQLAPFRALSHLTVEVVRTEPVEFRP
ncbi:MAG TPA: CDF family Co(II)/Ni(II) efflux transporter DmeF [Acetobacteraceae bacterium]|jgi:cation diffusion facilitator family transporter|nr:CDF family Co(II)/Ni(II) efflux transporter DmeF [Acetobacteraceae bacterium]